MRPLLVWWCTALCALLAVELLVFSFRLDTASLAGIDSIWAATFQHSAIFLKLAITAVVAVGVFGGDRIGAILPSLVRQREADPIRWWPLAGHLVAVMAFYQLSLRLFMPDLHPGIQQSVLICCWIGLGLLALALWVAAVLPISLWSAAASSVGRVLAVCVLLSGSALLLGRFANTFWQPLARWTFSIVHALLAVFYSDILVQPENLLVGTSRFAVQIAPQCSGYEGIALVTVFLSAYLWWFRSDLRFPPALCLIPVGIVLIWIANAVRIAALVVVGTSVSRDVAAGGFHSQAGWMTFNAVTLGLIAVAGHWRMFSKSSTSNADATRERVEYPAAPYLVPFLVMICMAMMTSAFSVTGVDQLYGLRVLATIGALAYFARVYRQREVLSFAWSWSAVGIGCVVFVMWMALEPLANVSAAERSSQGTTMVGMSTTATAVWILFRVVGSVLVVPLAEELAFRGFLIRRLVTEKFDSVPPGTFTWISFLISSVVFGLLHGRWLAGSLAGMLFALALYRRGRLSDAVLAHATANGLVTGYVLASQDWAAWS